jgi:hypothetical protein
MDPSPERGHEGDLVLHRQDDAAEHEEALDIDAACSPVQIVHSNPLQDIPSLCQGRVRGREEGSGTNVASDVTDHHGKQCGPLSESREAPPEEGEKGEGEGGRRSDLPMEAKLRSSLFFPVA